ncbi:hypothetical protein OsI_01092 [Oryza sativa Indica Group]|uniref:Uncharacterized protein n=1 Tax=Oryza sativa subsp. indica TaxID=39946 RepID=B8ABD9_ORYSI|nr:hypothetical protein OsI_01092 [Oryza sativa Indica Group]
MQAAAASASPSTSTTRRPSPASTSTIHLLDTDNQPWPDTYDLRHAEVVAAHHGSILFRTRVPFADPDFVAPGHFPVDCFVYTAGATAASPPSLTQLPRCFIDGFSDPVEDEYYKPYQLQRQQIMLDENIGFLSYSGDGGHEFMVADIRNYHGDSLELCIFNHHASSPSPSPEQWRIQRLEMHHASACKIGHSKKQLSDG